MGLLIIAFLEITLSNALKHRGKKTAKTEAAKTSFSPKSIRSIFEFRHSSLLKERYLEGSTTISKMDQQRVVLKQIEAH